MSKDYAVNEIFYSLQGEGYYTGTPAVFLRFSGCNRRCAFCDTDFAAYTEMSAAQIVEAVSAFPARHIVVTGGEPLLQLDDKLVRALRGAGFYIQVETNGSMPVPTGVDWVTCSPKRRALGRRPYRRAQAGVSGPGCGADSRCAARAAHVSAALLGAEHSRDHSLYSRASPLAPVATDPQAHRHTLSTRGKIPNYGHCAGARCELTLQQEN